MLEQTSIGEGTRTSYRPFADDLETLVALDGLLTEIEEATGPRQSIVRTPDRRAIVVEPGAPFTTLYVTDGAALEADDETHLRPLIDLSEFWRLWRPPSALVEPRDRAWLARRELDRDPGPPLPARYDDRDGWRDVTPDRLPELVAAVRSAAQRLSEGDADRQKGAA